MTKYACVRFAGLLSICLLAIGPQAQAQQYKSIPAKMNEKAAKLLLRQKVGPALRNAAALATNKADIDNYFKGYLYPTMTSTSPQALGNLAELRDDLFNQTLRNGSAKATQGYITKMTLGAMGVLAKGKVYHPAVRYNAVLVLGQLDQEYSGRGTGAKKPVPLPAGTAALLEYLESDTIGGAKIPTSLRLGALVGLTRHARFGIDPQYADRVTKVAIDLINQKEKPEDITTDVHHWLKCQAGQLLAKQYAAGPNAAAHEALIGMIVDKEMSLADRCCVAALLKEMDYAAAGGLDATSAVMALGGLATDVMSEEAEHARDYKKEVLKGFGGGNFRGGQIGLGRNRGGPVGPSFERRRLLDRLMSLADGIEGVEPAATPEAKGQLQALVGPIRPVITSAGAKDALDEDIVDEVIQLAAEVNRVIGSWKSAAAPANKKPGEADFS